MKVIVIGGLQIEIVSNTQEAGYNYAHACLPQVLITLRRLPKSMTK